MDNKSIQSSQNRLWIFADVMKHAFLALQNANASRFAASLAFYTIFSLAPTLLIALAVAGAIVGNEAARGELVVRE